MEGKSKFLSWLESREPYLRLAEVVAVTLIGSYIGWQQTKIASHSVEISERELEVSERELEVATKELKTAELQADIARTSVAPYFTFHNFWGEHYMTLMVRNIGGKCRTLQGKAIYYLEIDAEARPKRRVELTNFFNEGRDRLPNDKNEFEFRYPKHETFNGIYRALPTYTLKWPDENKPPKHRVVWYVELTFVDSLGNERLERFEIEPWMTTSKPAAARPTFVSSVDMSKLIEANGDPKDDEIRVALEKAIEAALKIPDNRLPKDGNP